MEHIFSVRGHGVPPDCRGGVVFPAELRAGRLRRRDAAGGELAVQDQKIVWSVGRLGFHEHVVPYSLHG